MPASVPVIYLLDLFGVAVFAVTGSLSAGKKRMDLFGVVVVALATALGGGTLRDVILGAYPVFWISDTLYIFVASGASLLTFVLARFFDFQGRVLKTADAFGLALFTIIGTQKALHLGVSPVVSSMMGVMTGVAGGIVRDMLSGEIPLILRAEIYATASLCGASTLVALSLLHPIGRFDIIISVLVTLCLRLAALHWRLSLPVFPSREEKRAGS
ncbi:MAG: trimeric intracellular cation channel family protein [Alphaproteobacteria bacterium]|uniref:Trimeric intracellular cation channel family protein n=1 Tax=Candidatus Nitrobium versatile TaxID=2884831 RepID=A0A953JB14_9BACT|nr:trimeric intracellular cation channel family protein [Candidatus Nitrobium versatile]